MKVVESVAETIEWVARERAASRTLGLVPTMGGLHEGHFSLVDRARRECDRTIATIFVNPHQFNDPRDFESYPRSLASDLEGLRARGVDSVFVGQTADLFPDRFQSFVEPTGTAEVLEGRLRAGHFRGVATIVLKLFLLCRPSRAYFGEKDYQQLLVVRALARDYCLDLEIVGCPTVREPDGLAMSSRNVLLTPARRKDAPVVACAIQSACEAFAAGERRRAELDRRMFEVLTSVPEIAVEYALVADPLTLHPCTDPVGAGRALVAVRLGSVRLIDNAALDRPPLSGAEASA